MEATAEQHLPDSPSGLLAYAREQRSAADAAEVRLLVAAVDWAAAHPVESITDAACGWLDGYGDTGIPIAGEGAPLIAEFCVAEWAASLGMSTEAGRAYLGDAVELRHRLPRLWRRVVAGDLQVWRARQVARQTQPLNPRAAAYVDAHVAHVAHKVGPLKVANLVAEAIARHDPDLARERQDAAADGRRFDVHTRDATLDGTCDLSGTLDAADALDLDHAVSERAAQMKALGSTDSLDVRRAKALGELARDAATLDLTSTDDDSGDGDGADTAGGKPKPRRRGRRKATLVIHLSQTAVTGIGDSIGHTLARVEGIGCPITLDQVKDWLATPDAQITIKPVVDADGCAPVGAYEIPDRLADLVDDRDHHCAFPFCHREARYCDHDHVTPHGRGGPTCPCNLALLCRRHHRHKTRGGWSYRQVEPGVHLWRSPHGYRYLRDHTGTRDVTPDPTAPRLRLIRDHRDTDADPESGHPPDQ